MQLKFTERKPGFSLCDYKGRQIDLGICSLERRRLKLHLTLTYKIPNGLVNLVTSEFFTFARSTLQYERSPSQTVASSLSSQFKQYCLLNSLMAQPTDFESPAMSEAERH